MDAPLLYLLRRGLSGVGVYQSVASLSFRDHSLSVGHASELISFILPTPSDKFAAALERWNGGGVRSLRVFSSFCLSFFAFILPILSWRFVRELVRLCGGHD